MKYLLGIDFGGGSTKATLINTAGNIVAENVAEYRTYYPQLGWCEQSPLDWEKAFALNLAGLLEKCRIDVSDILAIAIDSATHTWVMCDENYKPIRPAIHWTDSRCGRQVEELKKAYGGTLEDFLNYFKED